MSELFKLNKQKYYAIVDTWIKKYGIPPKPKYTYSPSKIRSVCRKCDKPKHRMQRHHKANDFFFAYALPEVYAARYIQFLKEDVDILCNACHKRWHRYLRPKLDEMYAEYKHFDGLSLMEKKKWCEMWRSLLLDKYERWILKPTVIKKERIK